MSDIVVGQIGEDGSPYVEFFLYGGYEHQPGLSLTGTIDTGFTGFLQINLLEACKVNLPLQGIGPSYTLADGSTVQNIQAIGYASLDRDASSLIVPGIVQSSEESEEVLIGMDFLRAFNKGLKIFKNKVVLVPDESPEGG